MSEISEWIEKYNWTAIGVPVDEMATVASVLSPIPESNENEIVKEGERLKAIAKEWVKTHSPDVEAIPLDVAIGFRLYVSKPATGYIQHLQEYYNKQLEKEKQLLKSSK